MSISFEAPLASAPTSWGGAPAPAADAAESEADGGRKFRVLVPVPRLGGSTTEKE
jgi:hypothetical protein